MEHIYNFHRIDHFYLYADDPPLICKEKYIDSTLECLNTASLNLNLQINTKKCAIIRITKRLIDQKPSEYKNILRISMQQNDKYLGVDINGRGDINIHIKTFKSKLFFLELQVKKLSKDFSIGTSDSTHINQKDTKLNQCYLETSMKRVLLLPKCTDDWFLQQVQGSCLDITIEKIMGNINQVLIQTWRGRINDGNKEEKINKSVDENTKSYKISIFVKYKKLQNGYQSKMWNITFILISQDKFSRQDRKSDFELSNLDLKRDLEKQIETIQKDVEGNQMEQLLIKLNKKIIVLSFIFYARNGLITFFNSENQIQSTTQTTKHQLEIDQVCASIK